jgi:hypothetical protein
MSRCILDDYIDLANTYLFVEAQIVDDDDTALWMHSLFSDVSVSLNEKLASPPTSLYPYRSFDVFRCLVCRRLVFFRLAGPLIACCPGGFYRVHSFLE